jgi:hypothetical protein
MKKIIGILLLLSVAAPAFASPPVANFECNAIDTNGDELSIQKAYLTTEEWNKSVTLQNVELLFMLEKNGKVSISTDLNDTAVFAVGEKEATLELHFSFGGAGSEGEKRIRELFCTIRKM